MLSSPPKQTSQREVCCLYLLCDEKLSKDDELLLNSNPEYQVLNWNTLYFPKDIGKIVIRNCYNYHSNHEVFLAYLYELEHQGHTLYNNANLVRWNINKIYLMELQKAGFKTVPSVLCKEHINFPGEYVVSKPLIANGGTYTEKVLKKHIGYDPLRRIYQQFLEGIYTEGEYSVIMIDGGISHTIHKMPAAGEFRIQHYFGGTYKLIDTPKEVRYTCNRLQWYLDARFSNILYLRLDFIKHENEYYLSEVEAIEPLLHFELYPKSIETFNAALLN